MKKTIKKTNIEPSKKPPLTPAIKSTARSPGKSPGSPAPSAAPAPAGKTAGPAPAPDALQQALAALRALHTLVESRLPAPMTGDQALEGSVDSLRRLLSELLEARTESIARAVAALRNVAVKTGAGTELMQAVEALLANLGAIRFDARRLDFVDPLIHRAVAERAEAGAPDSVILDTVQPGYKTARGVVLSRADVVINRRN